MDKIALIIINYFRGKFVVVRAGRCDTWYTALGW